MKQLLHLQAANNYTYEEIQVGLANCPVGGDPVMWLNDNWQKLIETVQTLATKYGQEHKENIVGTISAREAREALKKHKGNVWQAVTECIEQRRLAFNAIRAQGNYPRDDIVTYLTQHQGNVDLALNELNREQLKPFLLKILGSPSGIENQSAAVSIESASQVDEGSGNGTGTISRTDEEKNDILRDIEMIIGNMEEKQTKQTETILQTIESLVGNMILSTTANQSQSQPLSSSATSYSASSYDRIDVKSPVQLPKQQGRQSDADVTSVEKDVKEFVTSHIQDIVPDIAAMVNRELNGNDEGITNGTTTSSYEDDEYDDSAEYEDAIIELVLENPTQIDVLDSSPTDVPTESVNIEMHAASDDILTEPVPDVMDESIQIDQIPVETPTESVENDEIILTESVSESIANDENQSFDESVNQSEEPKPSVIKRKSIGNRPRFAVNKQFQRSSLRHNDRRRIRELERQLKLQQQRRDSDSRLSGYLSDSTVVAEGDEVMAEAQIAETIDAEVRTFSLSIAEPEHVETEQIDQTASEHVEDVHEGPSVETLTKDAKNRNLSELVQDTKDLIQKMKNEIDEDIAMSASEFGGDDSVSYDDDFDYSNEFDGESDEFDDSDGWTDIDDDDEDGDLLDYEDGQSEEEEEEAQENTVLSRRSSEDDQFAEAEDGASIIVDEEIVQEEDITVEHTEDQTQEMTEEIILNEIETLQATTDDLDQLPIDSVELLENIIEIQQSVQTSIVHGAPTIERTNDESSDGTPDLVQPTTAIDTIEAIEEPMDDTENELIEVDPPEPSSSHGSLSKDNSQNSETEEANEAESLSETTEVELPIEAETPAVEEMPTSDQSSNESLVETYTYSKITVPVISQCSQSSINVMQLKKPDANRNKIPVRRPSLSEPSASIRNLQNELINKQTKPLVKPVPKKPSKIIPPKLFFKDTLSVSPSKKSNDKKSMQNAVASTSSIGKTIPKKKYYETCFSDDYQTSDDEKPVGSSTKKIPNLVKIVETRTEDSIADPDAFARRLLDDGHVDNYLDAVLAVELIQMKFDEQTAIVAAIECNSLDQAIAFLRQDCELCSETYPVNKIVAMLKCTHSCCEECAKNYFTIQVSETPNVLIDASY